MGLEQRMVAAIEHTLLGVSIPYGILGLAQDTYSGPSLNLSLVSNSSLTINYFCRWAQVASFCEAVLGVNYTSEDDSRLSRSKPLQAPFRGLQAMYAVQCGAITGIAGTSWTGGTIGVATEEIHLPCWNAGKNLIFAAAEADDGDAPFLVTTTSFIEYEFAVVPITFSPVPYQILDDSEVAADKEWLRYTTVERTPRVELLNIKGGTIFWIDDPPINDANGQLIKTAVPTPDIPVRIQSVDYVVTWHAVPFCFRDFAEFVGYSNSSDGFLAGHPQVPADGFLQDRILLLGVREVILPSPFSLDSVTKQNFLYQFYLQDRANRHNNTLRRYEKPGADGKPAFDKFEYCDYSLTGKPATLNKDRVIKQANLAQLFIAR